MTTGLEDTVRPLREILERGNLKWLGALWDRNQYGGLPPGPLPEHIRELLPEPERVVNDLFFRGDWTAERDARDTLGEPFVDHFLKIGLLIKGDRAVRSAGLRFRPRFGYALLTGVIKNDGAVPDTVVHLGIDSMLCCEMITSLPRVDRALDLCAGSGILALCLARIADQVVAVEIDPVVAEVARINVALAGLSQRVHILEGDLFTPVVGEQFDLIVSNPPFSPSKEDYQLDRVGAGGPDGLDIVRAIWSKAGEHLREGGRVCVSSGLLGDIAAPFAEYEFHKLALRNGWILRLFELQEPRPMEHFWFRSEINEDRERRIHENLQAAGKAAASHHYFGIFVAERSSEPGYVRVPLFVSRDRQIRMGIRELRKMRQDLKAARPQSSKGSGPSDGL